MWQDARLLISFALGILVCSVMHRGPNAEGAPAASERETGKLQLTACLL